MLKAYGTTGERRLLVLGLSIENRLRLGEDLPILIGAPELAAMGIPMAEPFSIVLVGGDTEESIAEDLRAHGLPDPGGIPHGSGLETGPGETGPEEAG